MAIPGPSQQSAFRQRTILRVSVFVAVVSTTFAVALATGILPETLGPKSEGPQPPAAVPCPRCEPSTAASPPPRAAPEPPAAPSVAPPPAASAPAGEPGVARRYSVCESPSGLPIAQPLALAASGPTAIGVHCGSSVHVIAFDRGEPRRIATLALDAPNAAGSGHRLRAGALFAADMSGDGAIDLIAGNVREDDHGSPRGGALHELVRGASGAFEPPRLLAPLAIIAVQPAQLDDAAGADLAVLRLEESRLARGNEVVMLRGGPAPFKLGAIPAGVGMDRFAAVDMDLDGRTDVLLAAPNRPPELVLLGPAGQVKQRTPLGQAGAEALAAGDLNGDGRPDALLTGANAGVVLASNSGEWSIRPLPVLNGLSDASLLDWNGDGKLDVVGLREHTLLAFIQTSPLEFEARQLTSWPDRASELLLALPGKTAGSAFQLILIASPVQARGRAELILTDTVPADATFARAEPLPDAPLCQRFTFP